MNVTINQEARLSEHFTLAEMCKTNKKTKDGNIPSHVVIENLKRLTGWLEMLRSEWNKRYGDGDDPIIINSGSTLRFVHLVRRTVVKIRLIQT